MAEDKDIQNLQNQNRGDFAKLNQTLAENNAAEETRDKRRLDQATAHSQKNEKNLQALQGVVTKTESESTSKELKSDEQSVAAATAGMANIIKNAAKKEQRQETMRERGQRIIGKMNFVKDNKKFKQLGNFIGGKITGLGKSISSVAKTSFTAIKGGIGVLALMAFLQSDMFKKGVKFLVDFLIEFASLLDPKGEVAFGLNKASAAVVTLIGLLILKIYSAFTGIGMIKLAITGIQVAVGFLATGFGGLLSGLGAVLIPLLPVIAVVAAIAAVAYGIVRIFQGFQKHFGEANEQFGFFGGILAGFTGGIKMILSDIVGVIDSILGFFGFPDLMDPIIKAIEEFDVMDFVGGIMDFFSNLGNIIMESLSSFATLFKAIGAGAKAAFFSPFSPIESFNKAFDEVMAGGKEDSKPNLENIAAAGANMSGGENDPARFVARKENEDMQMRRKEELMDEKRAVTIVNNQNTVNKGGDNYSEVRGGDIHVHDQGKDPYTNMA